MSLTEFASLTLKYRDKPEAAPAGKFGTYLGRGDGTIEGRMLSGAVTWDLFEDQGATACDVNLVGTITTAEGAAVRFEVLGYFSRQDGSSRWRLASGIRFQSDDPRTAPLDNLLGVMEGEFDMESYVHRYSIFISQAMAASIATALTAPAGSS